MQEKDVEQSLVKQVEIPWVNMGINNIFNYTERRCNLLPFPKMDSKIHFFPPTPLWYTIIEQTECRTASWEKPWGFSCGRKEWGYVPWSSKRPCSRAGRAVKISGTFICGQRPGVLCAKSEKQTGYWLRHNWKWLKKAPDSAYLWRVYQVLWLSYLM